MIAKPHFGHIPEARWRIIIKGVILYNRLVQKCFISSLMCGKILLCVSIQAGLTSTLC